MILNYIPNTKYHILNLEYLFQILYICSTKLALKMALTKETDEKNEKIIFKDYFNSLSTDEERNSLRDFMVIGYEMGYTTFYRKVRENSFSKLELEKLESVTKQKFSR